MKSRKLIGILILLSTLISAIGLQAAFATTGESYISPGASEHLDTEVAWNSFMFTAAWYPYITNWKVRVWDDWNQEWVGDWENPIYTGTIELEVPCRGYYHLVLKNFDDHAVSVSWGYSMT